MQTLDIQAKEWFNKVNGNSYHSSVVTIDFGMPTEQTILVPFQYGYGSMYEQTAKKALATHFNQHKDDFQFCKLREKGVIIRSNIQHKCKKREVKSWGSSPL